MEAKETSSPESLNEQLIEICNQFPKTGNATLEDGMVNFGVVEKRKSSEHFQALREKLEELMPFSDVTDACKEYTRQHFEDAYAGETSIGWLIDKVNGDDGGYFSKNPETLREIERMGYRDLYRVNLILLQMHQAVEQRTENSVPSASRPTVDLGNRWKNEFMAKYHDEP